MLRLETLAITALSGLTVAGCDRGERIMVKADAEVLIAVENIVDQGELKRADVHYITASPSVVQGEASRRLTTSREFDCRTGRSRDSSIKAYSAQGKLLGEQPQSADWRAVSPGTNAASVVRTVCGPSSERARVTTKSVITLERHYLMVLGNQAAAPA